MEFIAIFIILKLSLNVLSQNDTHIAPSHCLRPNFSYDKIFCGIHLSKISQEVLPTSPRGHWINWEQKYHAVVTRSAIMPYFKQHNCVFRYDLYSDTLQLSDCYLFLVDRYITVSDCMTLFYRKYAALIRGKVWCKCYLTRRLGKN